MQICEIICIVIYSLVIGLKIFERDFSSGVGDTMILELLFFPVYAGDLVGFPLVS